MKNDQESQLLDILYVKDDIKQAIIDREVKVKDNTPFVDYPAKIKQIRTEDDYIFRAVSGCYNKFGSNNDHIAKGIFRAESGCYNKFGSNNDHIAKGMFRENALITIGG